MFLIGSGLLRGTLWRDVLAASWLLVVGVFLMRAAEQDYRFRVEQRAYEDEAQRLQAQASALASFSVSPSRHSRFTRPRLRHSWA